MTDVVALVRDEDYGQSLSLLLEMAGAEVICTTDERELLDLLETEIPSVVLLDSRLRTRLTPIFDHVQRHAINRDMHVIFLASSAVLPSDDRLKLSLVAVDRNKPSEIVQMMKRVLKKAPA